MDPAHSAISLEERTDRIALQRYRYHIGCQHCCGLEPDIAGEWIRYSDVQAAFIQLCKALLDELSPGGVVG